MPTDQKKAIVLIIISEKVNFKAKKFTMNKGKFIIIKG